MDDGSNTTYRFDGDARGLLVELRSIRAALVGTSTEATKTGKAIDASAGGAGFEPLSKSARAAQTDVKGLAAAQAQMADGAQATTKQLAPFGGQMKLNASQAQQLSYQLNDFFVQVSSGQGVLMPLIQQGSQLSGTFGGIRGAIAAVGTVLSPTVLLFGALAAAGGAVGYAFINGAREQKAFQNALVLTNNYAGQTRDSFRGLTQSIASVTGAPLGAVRDALQAVVSTGRFSGESIKDVTTAVSSLAKITGQDAADIVKDFAGMADGVAKWAEQHNKSYHYLNVEQYKYIRQLESQGRTQEAIAFNMKAFNQQLEGSRRNLGYLESAWQTVTTASKNAWDAMLGLGRDDTVADKVAKVTERLAAARAALAKSEGSGDSGAASRRRQLVANLEAEQESLKLQQRAEDKAAADKAAAAAKNERDIAHEQEGYQSAQASLVAAGLASQQAMRELARVREKIALDRGYSELLVSTRDYRDQVYSIDKEALADKLRTIDGEAKIAGSKSVGDEQSRIAQQAELVQIRSRRYAVEAQIAQLEERHRRFEDAPANGPQALRSAREELAQFERAQQAPTDAAVQQRREGALSAAHDLVRVNASLNADLIQDDRKRAAALFAIEEKEARDRIDFGAMTIDERMAAEERFAEWQVLRQKQITEQLKPEWQRRLDLWQDTNRYAELSYNDFITGLQDSGQNVWVEYAKTGKFNIKSLTDFAISELAKVSYQKTIAPAFTDLATSVGSFFGLGASTDGAGSVAAQTQAVNQSTGSLNSMVTAINQATAALSQISGSNGASDGGWAGIIAKLFGGGDGYTIDYGGSTTNNTGTSLPTAGGNALGGNVKRGGLHPVNEDGPELFTVGGKDYLMVGSTDGRVTSNRALTEGARSGGGGPAAAPNVMVNVKNEAGDVAQASATQGSDGSIEVLIRRVSQRIGADVARGRGPVAAGLKGRGVNMNGNLARVG